jgi:hypothetical protein
MKIAKADVKRVLDALQQLNEVRLERIRELIRQRNDFQQQLIQAQNNRDDRLTRWRERWNLLREENKKLRRDLSDLHVLLARKDGELREAKGLIQYAAMVKKPAPGMCDAQMTDEHSGEHDPHWCDKTPDHAELVTDGGSPHRCGDCKQEWVELD